MTWILLSLVFIPVLGGLLSIPAAKINKLLPGILTITIVLCMAAFSILLIPYRPFNNVLLSAFGPLLLLDGLSHLFLLTADIAALLVVFYAAGYLKNNSGKELFYSLFLFMLAGIHGVLLAGDFISLFLSIELAALSAYALVAYNPTEERIEASLKYFILGETASLFILLAIAIIYAVTGTFNLAENSLLFSNVPTSLKAFAGALFIAGFGMKAALFPFHFWLPDAHSAAPAPISALLSGVIIKILGVYAIVRILFNVFGMSFPLSAILITLASISIVLGGILSVGQRDMKRLMAYSSISQIGYIMLGFGLASPMGIVGALLHIINHAFMKTLLFLNAGAVESAAGTRDLSLLGGLRKKMPLTWGTSLVGSLSISGIPPFGGFWSKFFIILACIQSEKYWWLSVVAAVGGLLTLASFLRIQQYVFFGKPQLEAKEVSFTMCTSMLFLALICIILGLVSPLILQLIINPAMVSVRNGIGYGHMLLGGII